MKARFLFAAICLSVIGIVSEEATISVAEASPFIAGKNEVQVFFGDAEGNPRNWPEPVFRDGPTPWARIASNFDSVVFNAHPDAEGDSAFAVTPWARISPLRGENGFGLQSYFGQNVPAKPFSYQAITAMGALLGGALTGIDYSDLHRDGIQSNLVRLTKKWFNADTGAGVFLNNVHSKGGADWWYDILPNIFACQLSDIFGSKADRPGDPKLSDLCSDAIQRWYRAVDYLRDGRQVPEFAYKAVQLVAGPVAGSNSVFAAQFQPIAACDRGAHGYKRIDISRTASSRQICFGFAHFNGDTYQPDAAAGLAYLGLYGFETTGAANDRQLMDWGMRFLDGINYNPLYENLLPYGAYVSARMDAEYGTAYDTKKLLADIFSTSAVRPDWGMIGDSWDGTPVYGAVGSRKSGRQISNPKGPDYAFALNTMEFAATLAPIPRYDPSTAAAIGKYLSHVAHNARFFYPAYLRYADDVTKEYIAASGSDKLGLAIPFEGIQSRFRDKVPHAPYGTGDALKANRHGVFKTDLSVYSGIFAGAMARLFGDTNVPNIYRVDLLATDIPAPKSYPTYLYYNPYNTTKSVLFDASAAKQETRAPGNSVYMLYDAVSKSIPARNVSGNAAIEIPPRTAIVIVAVPNGDALEVRGHHLVDKNSDIVVDFDWQSRSN